MVPQSQTSIARSDYSGLKAAIHRRLIQKLDLDRLNQLKREDVRREVGQILETLVAGEATPMNLQERERLSLEVLDEVFGLGPLERLLRGSDDLRHSGQHLQERVRGAPRASRIHAASSSGTTRICWASSTASSRAIGRRIDEVLADGRRAPGGRLARQRHHSAAGGGRPVPVHPAFSTRAARRRRPGNQQHADAADAGLAAGHA